MMSAMPVLDAVYGSPPPDLAEVAADAAQVSPLIPGSARLEDLDEGSLGAIVMLAPAGTIERRYALSLALRALRPGGRLTALAPKDRGGARLGRELKSFGCAPAETARRHHRICDVARPEALAPLDEAIREGAPRPSTTSPSARSPASSPGTGSTPARPCCSPPCRRCPAAAPISAAASASWPARPGLPGGHGA